MLWTGFFPSLLPSKVSALAKHPGINFLADILLAAPDVIKEVTTSRRQFFPKPTFFYHVLEIFGRNVVTTEGETWKRHRKIASIGFNEKNNKMVHAETVRYVTSMFEEWDGKQEKSHDVMHYMLKVALCIISSAAFGFQSSWENKEKIEKGYKMTFFSALEEISTSFIAVSILPRWAFNIPVFGLPRLGTAVHEFDKYFQNAINMRKKEFLSSDFDNDSGSLFNSLIKATLDDKKDKELTLTEDELKGNIYVMMIAGHGIF